MKRAALIAFAVLIAGYLFVLVLGGWLFSGCVETRLEARIASALAADVEAADVSVSVATGKVEIKSLSIQRDGVDIEIESIRISLPSFGRMLWSRDVSLCVIDGATIDLSARGVVALAQRERLPLTAREFRLADVTISVSPTLLFPGLGKVSSRIESAVSRNVELTSATSWLSDLDEMVASADGPLGASGTVRYASGTLSLGGTWFGSKALSVPFKIPSFDRSLLEVDQLKVIGKSLLKAVAKHVAKDKIFDLATDLFK